jgi:hypothetical protein
MGWADAILGSSNPFAQWADSNPTVLSGIAGGLASGQNISAGLSNAVQAIGPAEAAQNAYKMSLADQQSRLGQIQYERQMQQNALNLQVQQRNAAADWAAKDPSMSQYSDAIRSGAISGADVFNTVNKNIIVPAGSTAADYQGKPIQGGVNGAGSFPSTDLKSQAWNYVMKANAPGADPALKADPQFQASWAIATEPVNTPNGFMQPQVPASWGPSNASPPPAPIVAGGPPPPQVPSAAQTAAPTIVPPIPAAQGPALQPAAAPSSTMPMVAPAAVVNQAPGILPGTQPFQESQQRTTFLANSATPDLERVIAGYPALMNFKDQVAGMIPGDAGRVFQSPAYKQTKDAMGNSMVNMLYFASGANISKEEWQRKVEAYIPAPGDDGQTAANKLDRFSNDVISLANSSKNPEAIKWAQQATQGLDATRQKLLGQGQPPTPTAGSGGQVPVGSTIWGPGGKQFILGADGVPKPVI